MAKTAYHPGKTREMAAEALAGFATPEARATAGRAIRKARRTAPAECEFVVLPRSLASDPGVSSAAKIVYAALLMLGPDARPRELAALVGCSPKVVGALFGELRRTGWLDYLLNGG